MAIEILENTLLKLLVRRGTNADRQQITLQSGELGYTTDTERLYIGNSTTAGGIVVGNKYKGSTADVTTLVSIVTGDYAYDTTNKTLKVCARGTGAEADDWITVSNYTSAGNATLNIDSQGLIAVGTSPGGGLSASNIDWDALGKSITLDGSLRAALSSTISIDRIINNTTTVGQNYLGLPKTLSIAGNNYTFPQEAPVANEYLGWAGQPDAAENPLLKWTAPGLVFAAVSPTTAAAIPVGTIVPYASAGGTLPWGWLLCNGQAVNRFTYTDLLSVISTTYGVGDGSTTFNVPNLTNKVLYSSSNPPTSTLMTVTTAASASLATGILSATGMQYIIKGINGVTSPTLTVGKNLSATLYPTVENAAANTAGVGKTDVAFDPLSGSIVIERPLPGQLVFRTPGRPESESTFTMPPGISYVKYYVTGSGARGGTTPGGAAATCIGYISAAPGTEFILDIAAVPAEKVANGTASTIYTPGAPTVKLVQSDGGIYYNGVAGRPFPGSSSTVGGTLDFAGGTGTGYINTGSPYILNGEVILGGSAGVASGGSAGSVQGSASYWGNVPAPGAGQAAWANSGVAATDGTGLIPTTGIIMFEWN